MVPSSHSTSTQHALCHYTSEGLSISHPHAHSPSTALQASRMALFSLDLPPASLYILVSAPSIKTSKAESDPPLAGAMLSGKSDAESPKGQDTFHGAISHLSELSHARYGSLEGNCCFKLSYMCCPPPSTPRSTLLLGAIFLPISFGRNEEKLGEIGRNQ